MVFELIVTACLWTSDGLDLDKCHERRWVLQDVNAVQCMFMGMGGQQVHEWVDSLGKEAGERWAVNRWNCKSMPGSSVQSLDELDEYPQQSHDN